MDIKKEVEHVNNTFNDIGLEDCTDHFAFGVTDKMVKLASEDGDINVNVTKLAYYMAKQCKELGMIPRKLIYYGLFVDECKEEGGSHKFYWKCENRWPKLLMNLLTRMNNASKEKPMIVSVVEWNILSGFDKIDYVAEDKPDGKVYSF